jgi:integrase
MRQHHPQSQQPARRATAVLTAHQLRMLLEAAQGSQLEALLTLAITTGMSRGEVLALHWSDLDLANQTVTIHRTVHWSGQTGYVEWEPKTPARRRHLPLSRLACEALKRHQQQQQEQDEQQATEQRQGDGLVFCTAEGAYLASASLTTALSHLLRQAGLPPLPFHQLRYSTAVLLMVAGVRPFVAYILLGLGRRRMSVLTPFAFSQLVDAMEVMDRLLGGDDPDDEKQEHRPSKAEQE